MALAMGALIGIERERRKGDGVMRAPAGLRTFALVALLGGLAAQSQQSLLVFLAGAFVAAAALLGYWLGDRQDPGLTTEVAMFATFLLGVEAQHDSGSALALAVIVTVLLAWRDSLHRFTRDVLSGQELRDGLIFAIAALVILPLLPDRAIDPLGLFNPFALWRVAVVLMGLNGMGYAAVRFIGPRYGLAMAGFASGFVSSSATIAAMGGRSRATRDFTVAATSGAVASMLGSLVYLTALVAATNVKLLMSLALPLATAAVVTFVYAAALSLHVSAKLERPLLAGETFGIRIIFVFAFFLGIFSLFESVAVAWFGPAGIFVGAIIGGAIDVHAAATAIATVIAEGGAGLLAGRIAILLALTANMLIKIPLAFAAGTKGFGTRVSIGLLAIVGGLWSAVFVFP
ncbi:MAG: MgtC/SapB family protein [Proteobacteria bacterium]|nr:MgtC/SapB family protein [Pseudomonadota bacterium]